MQYAWFYNLSETNIGNLDLNHNLFKKKEYFFAKKPHEICFYVHFFAHKGLICATLVVRFYDVCIILSCFLLTISCVMSMGKNK